MSALLKPAIVRILRVDGTIVGAGLLVTDRWVVTCAHVVAVALGLRADCLEPPTAAVQLDFPFVAPGMSLSASVAVWRPVCWAGSQRGTDIAGLQLSQSPPAGAQPARLLDATDLWGHPFRAFGFPARYEMGQWADGELRDADGDGRTQLQSMPVTGNAPVQGFSGTPVWDDRLDGVVGLVVTADLPAEAKRAWMIPTTQLIEAWPELASRTLAPCPYRGLAAFQEVDADYFFGRDEVNEALFLAVQSRPLTAVIGPSGSGKSSVVFAGLLPRLAAEGGWLVARCRPGQEPFKALSAALLPLLEPLLGEIDRLDAQSKLAYALESRAVTLRSLLERILEKQSGVGHLLLVVDQFEELYTFVPEPERQRRFLDQLLEASWVETRDGQPNARLVLTMRADCLGHALRYRPLAAALQRADLMMMPMSAEELRAAIRRPAEKLWVRVEDGLTERLVEAVMGEPGDLPLLEFALTQLWDEQAQGELTHAAYDRIGGVKAALAHHANKVWGELDASEQKRARRVFLQSVRPGEGSADTRRRATRAEVGEENWTLVERLADVRLVVTGHDEASGEETVEIVHEALIVGWGLIQEWLAEDRSFRSWQERLRATLRQWEYTGRDEGALLRGALLGEAETWLQERGNELSPGERAFIEHSVEARDQERVRTRSFSDLLRATGLRSLESKVERQIQSYEAYSQQYEQLLQQERQLQEDLAAMRIKVESSRVEVDQSKPVVFISYAREDESKVRQVYLKLKELGFRPWLDKEELIPGQNWNRIIREIARTCDFFLICLSDAFIRTKGYRQTEVKMAISASEYYPQGSIFIIPARLDECQPPEELMQYQYFDLFASDSFDRLSRAILFEWGLRNHHTQ